MTAKAQGTPSDRRLVYSVEEAAELLGMGRTFIFQLVASGEIDSIKIGNRRRIPRDAIERYLERLRAEQSADSARQQLPTFRQSLK